MKYIDLRIFLVSLAVGLFYIYISDDYKKVIILYPTPDNTKQYQYRDKTNTCFSYDLKEVKCPSDANLYQNVKIQK